jgi:hypothetical protein
MEAPYWISACSQSIVALQLVVLCRQNKGCVICLRIIRLYLGLHNTELILHCRTVFVTCAQIQFEYFILMFLTLYNLASFLKFIVQYNDVTRCKLLRLAITLYRLAQLLRCRRSSRAKYESLQEENESNEVLDRT